MGRPPLVSESPPFLWHLPRAHCLPEVCVWRLQTVCAGQAFMVSISQTREWRLMREVTCPRSMAESDSQPYPLTMVPPP